ncbi:MAG: hypothetical protein M4579_003772 [Chaenotheca gracillima]|nr:MAG: hypothetical protein M4579_003772 [Chaenotheca gracillima]
MPSVKPHLHALQTPKSASFPSELPRTPISAIPDIIKQEEGMKTPITPPSAYIDFLKAMNTPFTLGPTPHKSGKSTPTSNPSSAGSNSSCSCNCDHHQSPKVAVPPSPYSYPLSAPASGALRRIRIPGASPVFSPGADSPMSAVSMRSPFSARSPYEWDGEGKSRFFDGPHKAPRPVSVRQVVTRTVTYTPRMNLEPAPKGKKRRLE